MAWVRIHDGALSHPKVIAMFDPRRAFDLWLWGLSYCQQYLTDGRLPAEACPRGSRKAAALLVVRGLWERRDDGGYYVHDYLDWNDSREVVLEKRADAKERMRNVRKRTSRERSAEQPRERTRSFHSGVGVSVESLHLSEGESEGKPPPSEATRSKRPIFSGQRFTVFEWQLDVLSKLLGRHFNDFDIHGFLDELDRRAASSDMVIPQRDSGVWLQAQVLAEAQRRGLPIAVSSVQAVAGKQTSRLAAAVANIRASEG
jgi:hypothetical protein